MIGPLRQRDIFLAGISGRRPRVPIAPDSLERAARERLAPAAFAYLAGGAGVEDTIRANRDSFGRWRIVPRMLRGAAERDISITLFGSTLPAPLLLAPIGVLELAHREADLAVARAAAAYGVPFIFSNQASVPMERCAAVMGEAPRWFQLYWSTSDALVESFVSRAERCGCSAIVLTLDTTLLGWRPRDLDLAYLPFLRGRGIAQYTSDPVFRHELAAAEGAPADAGLRPRPTPTAIAALVELIMRYPGAFAKKLRSGEPRRAVRQFVATYSRPSLAWDDLGRLRGMTHLPLLLKGVLHPDDARRALDAGVDGVIVSNHGGRQVDGAIGSLDALPDVVDAIDGRVPVLFDSGIRTGADVFRALALGASAVCLGRPYAFGLALAGEAGVREVIQNLLAELDLTMGLAGCRSVAEIRRDCVTGERRGAGDI
jgi:lactate 2-monooxygenase